MARTKTKFSLKKKLTVMIVFIIVAIILLAGFFCYRGMSDFSHTMYTGRVKELSATAADIVDPYRVKNIHDRVMTIFNSTEDRVSTEDWGSPEFNAYLEKYKEIEQSEDYQIIRDELRLVQDNNDVNCVYIICFDIDTASTIYLVDAAYDDICPPGCFDAVMYDVDYEAMKNPDAGLAADITNTDEYGWLVAAGSPIYADGELVGFAAAEILMNDVVEQRNKFLAVAFIALILSAAVFIIGGIILIDRMIVRPINKLSETSERYWNGETSAIRHEFSRLNIHTGDEIETLSNSMKLMEQNINEHIAEILKTTEKLISMQEHAEDMDRAANIDALTKVRNRRAFDVELARINAEIRDGKTAFGIAMLDLNYLKKTNDSYGHEKGDEAIRTLCGIICGVFKHSPVFRIGGDEFVVVLENQDYELVDELKEDFEKKMENLQQNSEPWTRIYAATGYALFEPEADKNIESVLKRADKLMYERKKEMKAEKS